jgi:hypothetical protein
MEDPKIPSLEEKRLSLVELKEEQLERAIKNLPQTSVEELENRFKWHKPKDSATGDKHDEIRQECLALAEIINDTVPEGREKVLAFTKLEEVMMWANAGIARNS